MKWKRKLCMEENYRFLAVAIHAMPDASSKCSQHDCRGKSAFTQSPAYHMRRRLYSTSPLLSSKLAPSTKSGISSSSSSFLPSSPSPLFCRLW